MHRTSGTILATSQNNEKHLSPPHCFTQARGYNTRTNPLPLFHTGEEDPFPLFHTGERVSTGLLGTENLATFNSTKSFSTRQTTLNMQHMRIYILPTKYMPPHHTWELKFHHITPSTYQIIHSSTKSNE